jgi:hypothetical protein
MEYDHELDPMRNAYSEEYQPDLRIPSTTSVRSRRLVNNLIALYLYMSEMFYRISSYEWPAASGLVNNTPIHDIGHNIGLLMEDIRRDLVPNQVTPGEYYLRLRNRHNGM